MTISPSSTNPEDNMKVREIYCPTCKVYKMSKEAHPVCPDCFNYMITVVYSVMDGKRLTGDELVTRDNKTT